MSGQVSEAVSVQNTAFFAHPLISGHVARKETWEAVEAALPDALQAALPALRAQFAKEVEKQIEGFIERQTLNTWEAGDVVAVTSLEYFAESLAALPSPDQEGS